MSSIPYKPIYNANSLLLGEGENILITGWTKPEKIASLLDVTDYAVIGPLYNPIYGLNPLIANLLANPQFSNLFLLYSTKADLNSPAVLAFYEFLESIPPTVDRIISSVFTSEDLESLRGRLKIRFYTELNMYTQEIKATRGRIAPAQEILTPIYVELPKVKSDTLPAPTCAHIVRADTIVEAWLKLVDRIRRNGKVDGNRQELINCTSVILNEPEELFIPLGLPITRQDIENYLPSILETATSTTQEQLTYTYGTRIRALSLDGVNYDQLKNVVKKLDNNLASTQCYISLWEVTKDIDSSSPPCLTSLWVRVVENKLVMVANFRSHDIYTAYLSNLYGLRKLQEVIISTYNLIQEAKGVPQIVAGELVCNSLSAHIYSWSWQQADETLQSKSSLKVTHTDLVGNFVIQGNPNTQEIIIIQLSPRGEPVREYNYSLAKFTSLTIIRELIFQNPAIQADHAAYLALELQQAITATQVGISYTQDQVS